MKIVLQRVREASVDVEGRRIAEIGSGLLLLVGLRVNDTEAELRAMAEKILNLRVFPNEQGRFDRSVVDAEGEILLVSQFTLYGDTKKGRRPDFAQAMPPDAAREMFAKFVEVFPALGFSKVAVGEFGAHMKVRLENDGPVTLVLEISP